MYLVTDRDESDINQFEKHFNIDCFGIKDIKAIVLNEIDAINRKGRPIYAK